ncbi:MAG: GAF domain-containing protein, partial [Candidatus Bathyarchaeota archaeon]
MDQEELSDLVATVRVLHVDDEEQQCSYTKLFLEEADPAMHVDSASSAEEALSRLQDQSYDCIVSDYVMPRMDGVELCRRIRESSDLPFILYTGRGSEEVAEKAFQAGVDGYLRKELDPSHYVVLANRIRATVDKHRAYTLVDYLNDVLRAIRNVNQLIVTEKNRDRLLQRTCELLVGTESYHDAWIILLDENREPAYTSDVGMKGALERIVEMTGDGEPPECVERALEQVEVQVFSPPDQVCVDCPLVDMYADRNLLIRRLGYGGDVYGVLAATVPLGRVGGEERELFSEVAGDISFALYSIELEEERMRMEEAARREREWAQKYLDVAAVIMVVLDSEGRVALLNREGCRVLGCTVDECLRRDWFETYIPVRMRAEVKGVFRKLMVGEVEFARHYDNPVLTTSGEERLISWYNTILRDDEGNITGTLSSGVDITEQRLAEEKLRVSEKKYMTIVESSPNPISVTIGPEIVYANQKRVELTGHPSRDALIGTRGLDHVAPEDREQIQRILEARKRGEEVSDAPQFRMIGKDGTIIHAVDHTSNIIWEDREAVLHNIQDITKRKKIEDALYALHIYSQAIHSAKIMDEVYTATYEVMEKALGFSVHDVIKVENGMLIDVIGTEIPQDPFIIPLDGPGVTARAARTGASQLVPDTRAEPDYVEGRQYSLSELAVPVMVDGEPVVVLNVESPRLDAFSEEDQMLVEILAQHVSTALALIRGRAESLDYERRLQALHSNALKLASAVSLEEVYDATLDAMERSLGFGRNSISMVEDDVLKNVGLRGLMEERMSTLPLTGKGLTVRAARTGKPVLVPDVSLDPDYIDAGVGIKSELVVPVKIDGVVVGVLNTESTSPAEYDALDVRLMEILAAHYSVALVRLERQRESREYEERLEALHKHASDLASSSSLLEVGEKTFDAIKSVLGFDLGSFVVVEGSVIRYIYTSGLETGERAELPLDGPSITVRAVRTGEPQLVPDVRLDEDFIIGRAEGRYKPLSELAVPIKIFNEVIGAINIESEELNKFTEEDQRLLEIFASHVASAMSRLRDTEALKASEERYRTLLEESLDAVFVLDTEKYLYANQNAAELLGFDNPSELVGQDAFEFVAPEDRERVRRVAVKRQRGGDVPSRYEFTLLNRQGVKIPVESHVSLIEYDGRPASLSFTRDITDRKRMEEELRRRDQEKTMILDGMMDLMSLKDKDYRYIWVNRALADSIGSTPEALVGKICYEATYGRKEPCEGCGLDEVFESGEGRHDLVTGEDGRVFDAWLEPIKDESGNTVSVLETAREVTERKLYETRLEALHLHADSLSRAKTIREVAETTFTAIDDTIGFTIGSFGLVEENILHHILIRGVEGEKYQQSLDGPGITVRAVNTGETQLVPDITEDEDYVEGLTVDGLEISSELAVPVMQGREAMAVINIESSQRDAFSEYEQKLVEILAGQVASAMRKLRYERRLKALHSSANWLTTARDREAAFNLALETIEHSFGFGFAGIAVVEEDQIRYVKHIGAPDIPQNWALPMDKPSITRRAVTEASSQIVQDVREDPDYRFYPTEDDQPRNLSELSVPVKVDGIVTHVINVESPLRDQFTQGDRELIEILASHLSSAISRLQRVKHLEQQVKEKTRELLDAERLSAAGRVAAMVGHDLRSPLQAIRNSTYLM